MYQLLILKASNALRKFDWGEIVSGQDLLTDYTNPPKIVPTQTYKVYCCSDPQLDILSSKAKYTFAFAGTGGGKTCLIPLWLFKQISKKPTGRYLVVSPSLSIFDSSELKRHILDTFQDTNLQGNWLDGKKKYLFPGGGEIVVKTVNDGSDYGKLTGGQYDAIVADEVYFLTKEVWEEIRRRSNIRKAPVLAVTTPNSNTWIYEIKQKAEAGDKDYYVRQWGTAQNPASNTEHLKAEAQLMSAAQFKRMYEGQFSSLEGLVYECFSNSDTEPVITADPRKGLPSKPVRFTGGIDWGYSPDPFAAYIAAECEDGITYVVEEIYQKELGPDQLVARLRSVVDRWAISYQLSDRVTGGLFGTFWCDHSRPELVTHLRRAGIPTNKKRVDDVAARIATTDAWFRSGRLKIYSCCTNVIRELRGYQWSKDRSGGLKDCPVDKNNHGADALSYMISSAKYGQQITPLITEALPAKQQLEAEQQKASKLGVLISDREIQELKAKQWKQYMQSLLTVEDI